MLRLYRKPSKGLIGVDISSTSVKVLELSVKNNRYWVESYALVPLPEGSVVEKNILNPEAVGDALERAVNLANVQSTDVALAVPTSMVITKIIEMGVVKTPGIAVDGIVKISGKLPSIEEIKELL